MLPSTLSRTRILAVLPLIQSLGTVGGGDGPGTGAGGAAAALPGAVLLVLFVPLSVPVSALSDEAGGGIGVSVRPGGAGGGGGAGAVGAEGGEATIGGAGGTAIAFPSFDWACAAVSQNTAAKPRAA